MRALFCAILLFPLVLNAQAHKSRKSKISTKSGTLFLSYGLNSSFFSKSKIDFIGTGYDFTLTGVKGKDQPIFRGEGLEQFNARLGYTFTDAFAISVGIDHMKYGISDGQTVLLNGKLNGGVDPVTGLSGSYFNEAFTIDTAKFNYAYQGLNFINLKISRLDRIFWVGKYNDFTLTSDFGCLAGLLASSVNYNFAGNSDFKTSSLSGVGIAAYAGLRFEFLRHFFIQTGFSVGYMRQLNVRVLESNPNAYNRQSMAYGQMETTFGCLFYIRPKNDCNSCPSWGYSFPPARKSIL
jgi:hypothetical protein